MKRLSSRPEKPGIAPPIPQKNPALLFLLFILLVFGPFGSLFAQMDTLEITAVPITEIATVAASDRQAARDFLKQEVQVTDSYDLVPNIDSLENQVAGLEELSRQILGSRQEYSYYNSLILRWERIKSLSVPIQDQLKKYLADMEMIKIGLEDAHAKWDLTLQETDPSVLSENIVSRINGIQHYIDSTRQIVGDSLNISLALQNRITDLDLVIESHMHEISELQKLELGNSLLTRENSIFKIERGADSLYFDGNRVFLLTLGIQDSKVYLQNEWPVLLLLGLCFLALLIAFIFLRKGHGADESGKDQDQLNREKVLTKPVATAFIFTMLLSLWWLPARPVFLREVYTILFILPFLPIFRALAFKAIRYILLYLFAILLYNILNDYMQTGPVYLRLSSLFESIALFSFHLYFFYARRGLSTELKKKHLFYRLLRTVQPFYFLLTLLAVVANFIGYWNYAELVNEAVLLSLILLMLFATGFFSLTSVIHLYFRTKSADKSLLLKANKERIYKWLFRNLRAGALILWLIFTLRSFFLWDPLLAGINKVLDIGHQFGEITISIGDILSFVLVVYLSWLISFIIRNLLEVELFGRLTLPRGVPKAISSLSQYFLITLGFMMALSAAGFNMQNLGILAGALGVGIGFGLQNIVNNFISGLILAFERPVTVDDIIIVAEHEGVVKKIGIRASVIEQYDGSEVIVPNSELISQKVINWTLQKYTRRMIMTIHTHVDADTEQVLKLMTETVNQVDFVLKKPAAKSYFHGVKDKQLEFALYYWASGNILDCKSIVNQKVQKALKEAGIEFVMPVHVVMQKDQE